MLTRRSASENSSRRYCEAMATITCTKLFVRSVQSFVSVAHLPCRGRHCTREDNHASLYIFLLQNSKQPVHEKSIMERECTWRTDFRIVLTPTLLSSVKKTKIWSDALCLDCVKKFSWLRLPKFQTWEGTQWQGMAYSTIPLLLA